MSPKAKKIAEGFTVVKPFRDSDEYVVDGFVNRYEIDDNVSHFDESRLKNLVKRGLVKETVLTEKDEE